MTDGEVEGTGESGSLINKVLNKIAETAGFGSSERDGNDPVASDGAGSVDPRD